MKTLSEWAWAWPNSLDWSSARKLPYFEADCRAGKLDALGCLRYAMLLCDQGRLNEADRVLCLPSVVVPERFRFLSDCCVAMLALLAGEADGEQRLECLGYHASLLSPGDPNAGPVAAMLPGLIQLLFRHGSELWRPSDERLADTLARILEVIYWGLGEKDSSYGFFMQLLVVCGKRDLAINYINDLKRRDIPHDEEMALMVCQLWMSGEVGAAAALFKVMPDAPSGNTKVDYIRALSAAMVGEARIAYENYRSVLRGQGYYPGQGSILRHLWDCMIFRSMGWDALLEFSWDALKIKSDYLPVRWNILNEISAPSRSYPLPPNLGRLLP